MKGYGKELIMDLHECNPVTYRNREELEDFLIQLCDRIGMQRCDINWWDYAGCPEEYKNAPIHLKGTSVVQFISTSTITIHALDELRAVYIDIFSCKDFDTEKACEFTKKWFEGKVVGKHIIDRK